MLPIGHFKIVTRFVAEKLYRSKGIEVDECVLTQATERNFAIIWPPKNCNVEDIAFFVAGEANIFVGTLERLRERAATSFSGTFAVNVPGTGVVNGFSITSKVLANITQYLYLGSGQNTRGSG